MPTPDLTAQPGGFVRQGYAPAAFGGSTGCGQPCGARAHDYDIKGGAVLTHQSLPPCLVRTT